MKEHVGRIALVSGAGSGIGRATALALASHGVEVLVQDVQSAAAKGSVDLIVAAGGVAKPLVFDVRDENSLEAALRGTPHVSMLVHCAGIAGSGLTIDMIDRQAFDEMFSIHVWGAYNLVRQVVPGMRKHHFGRIINVASNRGQVGFERSSHYSAAKAALINLSKSWAREFAPDNILVNAIAPGVVRTGMTEAHGLAALKAEAELNLLKRWAEPEEIAATALFLVGAGGNYYTGQVLFPNGGDPIVGA
jgi:NAD(P)-dependent dehydrogenase (short-subunit alcohol dehydrogenase family)